MTVKQKVEADFSARGTEAYAGALKNIQDVAGGVVGRLTGLLNIVNPLNLALGGLASGAAVAGIIQVGSSFENMKIQMAQTMRFMDQADTFPEALNRAEQVMQRIMADSAALPGEAEDYAKALQLAGANVDRATGDYERTYSLIRDMTAIGASMGRGAEETAMQLNRALNTQRGMLEQGSDYTNELVNAMREVPGRANLTAASFNNLRLEERVELMGQLAGQFSDMIGASSTTWSAVSGAAQTVLKTMIRLATGPMFEAIKSSLSRINALFLDGEGNLTEFGRRIQMVGEFISTHVGGALEWVVTLIEKLAGKTGSWIESIANSRAFQQMSVVAENISRAMGSMSPGTAGAGVAGVGALAAGAGGPATLALGAAGGGFAEFLTHTEEAARVGNGLVDMLASFSQVFEPIVGFMGSANAITGDLFASVLPELVEGLDELYNVVWPIVGALFDMGSGILDQLRPAFDELWESTGRVVSAYYEIQRNVLVPFGLVVLEVAFWLSEHLVPAIQNQIDSIEFFVEGIAIFLEWIAEVTGRATAAIVAEAEARQGAPEWYNSARAALLGLADAADTAAAADAPDANRERRDRERTAPSGRGGGRTVQDFRFSRFQIEQKFEEGFDPDRIAVAFARDVGSMAEQRLQSGFEPLFGVR